MVSEDVKIPEPLKGIANSSKKASELINHFVYGCREGRALNLYFEIKSNEDVMTALRKVNPLYAEIIDLSFGVRHLYELLDTAKQMYTIGEIIRGNTGISFTRYGIGYMSNVIDKVNEVFPDLSAETKSFLQVAEELSEIRSTIVKELYEFTKPQIPITKKMKKNFIKLSQESIEKINKLKKQYDVQFKKLAESYVRFYKTLYQKCKEASELSFLPPVTEEKWKLPTLDQIIKIREPDPKYDGYIHRVWEGGVPLETHEGIAIIMKERAERERKSKD
jgi:molybdopterin converting factor small subunit